MLQSSLPVRVPRPAPSLERRMRWEQGVRLRLTLTDALIITTVFGATVLIEQLVNKNGDDYLSGTLLFTSAWLSLLTVMRTRAIDVLGSGIVEYRRIVHAAGLAGGATAALSILFEWQHQQAILFIAAPTAVVLVCLSRWIWRHWLQRQRMRGQCVMRTLIVGNEVDVRYVIGALSHGNENGTHIIGATVFDFDTESSGATPHEIILGEHTIPVHGTPNTVAGTAQALAADRIVIASTPPGRSDFVKQLSWRLEGTASELVISHRITDVVGPRITFTPLDGLPLLRISIPSYEGGKHVLKRALDVCVSALALVPVALLTPFVAAAIKLDSAGPVFYRQTRLGVEGRTFSMLKFRTMREHADTEVAKLAAHNEGAGPLFKLREDPRVTRVGHFLRRTSLDELPQFWNVLMGDMSVVGPRPPLPTEAQEYDSVVTRRLYIKPGITGLWQISGRSDLSWDESVRLDLRYVENWSLMQDLQIMWRTARVMLFAKGAY